MEIFCLYLSLMYPPPPPFIRDMNLQALTPSEKSADVLYQLQTMFAFLQESRRSSYDTKPFTSAYCDTDGKPINVMIQMDADEVLKRNYFSCFVARSS
jgi:hypothetical protein